MNVHRLLMLLYVVFAVLQAAAAQDHPYGFYFTGHRTRVQIPFLFRSNLIIIPVCINERDQVHFIVDTGVGHTIITDAQAFRNHPFTVSRTIKLAGVGEGSTLLATITIGNSMRLGSLRIDHHPLVILNEDVLKLSEYAGVPIQGIIGYELFANLVVSIDFQQQVITLTQPDKYRYRPRKGERYPISIQDNKAYTEVLSVANGKDAIPLRVILDTGAGQALLLDRFCRPSPLPMPGNVVRVPLGRGLNGLIHGHLGRVSAIYFGRYALSNVLVSYPDSSDFGLKLTQMSQRQGNIGCELLRRFRVTFNYPESYIVLKPVKRMMRQPFEHDMSGLELRARGDDFGRYFIDQVVRHSPADQSGLQNGDELLIINGNAVSMLTMGGIYELLQAGDGKPISMIVRRQGQLLTVHFSLKRLI